VNVIKGILQFSTRLLTDTVYLITIYYLFISFFGLYQKKDNSIVKPVKKFALIVAAHNEEVVIGKTVDSLKNLNYPKELYDIFVIADNCNDNTASEARKSGALVFERVNKDNRGKGYALGWMFDILFKMDRKYDAVAIFDADNIAHSNFLLEMNKKLSEGFKVVQGYLDSKNPEDTWVTGSYSIAFWTNNRIFQLARANLGLSNQLGGTGFCVELDILKKLGWGATCLTEDLEFSCKLILNGYRVGWAHHAIIYDEKPLKLKQSWAQRKRWMQGFSDVSSRYFFKLLKRSILKLNFTAFDCAIYSIQPIVTILLGLSAIISLVQYAMKISNVITNFNSVIYSVNLNMLTLLLILLGILQYVYTPFILILEHKLNMKIFLYYLIYPIYAITWFPISIQGIINRKDKEWNHTIHTRNVDINELEKVN
jgi:cellulose synthase/poly-beta-1,6-N-acetylglucosamine synthase-like glycosyltransferase